MRGGCGCDKQQGGADETNLAELKPPYSLSNDNQLPDSNQSSRIGEPIIGGKRHNIYKILRKVRGGASSYLINPDAITSTGNTNSSYIANNLMTNSNVVDPDVSRQPVANTYSIHSPPLV